MKTTLHKMQENLHSSIKVNHRMEEETKIAKDLFAEVKTKQIEIENEEDISRESLGKNKTEMLIEN